jgi:hypothetical protein
MKAKTKMTTIKLEIAFKVPTHWVPPDLREELSREPATQEEFFECPREDGVIYQSLFMQLGSIKCRKEVLKCLVSSLDYEIIEAVIDHLCTNGYLGSKYIAIPRKEEHAQAVPGKEPLPA